LQATYKANNHFQAGANYYLLTALSTTGQSSFTQTNQELEKSDLLIN